MKTIRRSYSENFKEEAVRLAEDRGVTATARDLGIHPSMIRRRKRQLQEEGEHAFPGKGNPKDEALARLPTK